jgi:hypothetical protein
MLATASAFHREGANMKALRGCVAAACVFALGTGPANAVAITETINFTAGGFAGAPIDHVGSFTITFDPTTSTNVGTTIALNNLNITPSANPLLFAYFAPTGQLGVCSTASLNAPPPACLVSAGDNSFFLSLLVPPLSTPIFVDFLYSQSASSANFSASGGSASIVPGPIAGAGLPGLIRRALAFSAGGDGVGNNPNGQTGAAPSRRFRRIHTTKRDDETSGLRVQLLSQAASVQHGGRTHWAHR